LEPVRIKVFEKSLDEEPIVQNQMNMISSYISLDTIKQHLKPGSKLVIEMDYIIRRNYLGKKKIVALSSTDSGHTKSYKMILEIE
jgi:hypothetical protein